MAVQRVGMVAGAICVAASILSSPINSAMAADLFIGTGSKTGVYFQVGRAICRIVKRSIADLGCRVMETEGSISNVVDLASGTMDFGVVQSDVQFHAVNKSGPFEFVGIDLSNLRSMFSLHSEPFTLVARRDSGIRKLDDLAGRRVNIGNPGSGQRATMEAIMAVKGWTKDIFQLATELPAAQQSLALCHGRVQAMVYTVGHPNDSITKATQLCDSVIVEVTGPEVDGLVASNPYYTYAWIPGGMYAGNPESTKTFGVKAVFMTSSDVDADTVYAVVKSVFDNLERFKRMHPTFARLEPMRMTKDGVLAPLHEGAIRYFRQRRLMQ